MRTSLLNRRTVHFSALGLALLVSSTSGCQGWWNRSKTQSLLGFTKETQQTDDWEHPSAPSDRDPKVAPSYNSLAKPSSLENAGIADKPYRVTLPRDRQKELAQSTPENPDLATLPNPKTAALESTSPGLKPQANLASTLAAVSTLPTISPADRTEDRTAEQTATPEVSTENSAVSTAASAPETQPGPPVVDKPVVDKPVADKPVANKKNTVSEASATVPVTPPPNAVLDSGQSEVDIEGALALLPADYQAVLRKKISGQADREKQPGEKFSSEKSLTEKSAEDSKDPSRWSHELNQSVVALEKHLEAVRDIEPAIRQHHEMTLRLLYLAQRNLQMAKRPIPEANPREQEYLDHQLTALFQATSPDANPSRPRHWAQVAAEQKLADRQLAALSNLQVSPPIFCTQVDGFGATHRFDKYCFKPEQQVLLYCELDHVTSQRVREGYESKIRGTYEIRDSQGKRIVEQILPMEPDVCSSPRRDYFLVYMIYMPPNVESGKYELILSMEDLTGNKFGTSKSEFEIKK